MKQYEQNVAILMMQKNENELLEKWIVYHEHIFGLSNLYVFDNGSDDAETIRVLKYWQLKGLNVDWSRDSKQDFELKGTILGNKIKELDSHGNYLCFMPLDCDEFVGVKLNDGKISCESKDILAEINSYSETKDVLLIDTQYFNSPISENWFHRNENRKCFFMKNTFEKMDVGFHWGKVKDSDKELKTNIVQFHFHYKPFEDAKEHAKNKLALRVDSFDREYLANYKGPGLHLTKYFLLTEKEYLKRVLNAPHFYIKAISTKFDELDIMWPYKQKLIRSLNVLQPNVEPTDINAVEKLHNTVDHKFRGSIDQVVVNDGNLVLDGWAAAMGINQVTTFIISGTHTREIEITQSVFRPDIARLLGFKDRKFGFRLVVPATLLAEVEATSLDIKAKFDSGEVGPTLSINTKFLDTVKSFFTDRA